MCGGMGMPDLVVETSLTFTILRWFHVWGVLLLGAGLVFCRGVVCCLRVWYTCGECVLLHAAWPGAANTNRNKHKHKHKHNSCRCCYNHCCCCWLVVVGGGDQQQLMQELIASAKRPVAAGKVRRKKAKEELNRAPPRDKSKGFAKAR